MCHLVGAPILQVDDVATAMMARRLHGNYGRTGTVCFDEEIDDELRADIILQLGPVPHRGFITFMGEPIFL